MLTDPVLYSIVLVLQPLSPLQLLGQPGTLLLLLLMLLLSIPLEQERERKRRSLSHLIPSMRFFRIAIAAALVSGALGALGIARGWQSWTGLISLLSLYVAFVDIGVGFVWQL
ncbi:MAG: hypothetical protein EBZ51_12620, partial [Synechococcaceae bacterium WB9_2_112]|nr:hypothetical protein [Synechococcaceae bacterium WB9_2_112]